MSREDAADVLIAGAGLAGGILALALDRAGAGLDVRLLDGAPARRAPDDIRAYAIAAGTKRMLGALGIWDRVSHVAQAVAAMDITDGRLADVVRPVLLTFEGEAREGEPFAHFVDGRHLQAAVAEALDESQVPVSWGKRVRTLEAGGYSVRIETDVKSEWARLAVGADGARSAIRRAAGIPSIGWPYRQSAIVAIVSHQIRHEGRAVQHFLPEGPFAMLPLANGHSGIVWTVGSEEAGRLMRLPKDVLAQEFSRAAGPERGRIEIIEGPRAQALELGLARRFIANRIALVGDAAHRVHPLAGQGLNIGFRDVAALAQVIVEAARRGEDIGGAQVLERYQRWRRFDAVQFAAATDLLNRVFSNDSSPLRMMRDIGLGVVHRAAPLKSLFMREAAGQVGRLPRLMEGEPI